MSQTLLLNEDFNQCAVRPLWGGGTRSYIALKEVGNFSCFHYMMIFSLIFLQIVIHIRLSFFPCARCYNIELPEFIYAETISVTHTQIMGSSTHSYSRWIATWRQMVLLYTMGGIGSRYRSGLTNASDSWFNSALVDELNRSRLGWAFTAQSASPI